MSDENDFEPSVQAVPGFESLLIKTKDTARLEKYGSARAFREAIAHCSLTAKDGKFTLWHVIERVQRKVVLALPPDGVLAQDILLPLVEAGYLERCAELDPGDDRHYYLFHPEGRPLEPV